MEMGKLNCDICYEDRKNFKTCLTCKNKICILCCNSLISYNCPFCRSDIKPILNYFQKDRIEENIIKHREERREEIFNQDVNMLNMLNNNEYNHIFNELTINEYNEENLLRYINKQWEETIKIMCVKYKIVFFNDYSNLDYENVEKIEGIREDIYINKKDKKIYINYNEISVENLKDDFEEYDFEEFEDYSDENYRVQIIFEYKIMINILIREIFINVYNVELFYRIYNRIKTLHSKDYFKKKYHKTLYESKGKFIKKMENYFINKNLDIREKLKARFITEMEIYFVNKIEKKGIDEKNKYNKSSNFIRDEI